MEIAIIKTVVAGAFFATLITAAFWAGDKWDEYKNYFKEEDENEDS